MNRSAEERGFRMYRSNEPIRWGKTASQTESDSELARGLRELCERSSWLSSDVAREAVFWLDLGLPPRTVERWLLAELMRDPEGALPVRAQDAESCPVSPTRKRHQPRFSRRHAPTIR
jgi:hypothetical protein